MVGSMKDYLLGPYITVGYRISWEGLKFKQEIEIIEFLGELTEELTIDISDIPFLNDVFNDSEIHNIP